MIRTKSVLSPIDSRRDGFRILITRFRGRGLPKNRYRAWMANLGPSEKLLRSFQSGRIQWATFARRYRAELFQDGGLDRSNRAIKNHGQKFALRLLKRLAKRGTVTLMCHCAEGEPQCHRNVLEAVLQALD